MREPKVYFFVFDFAPDEAHLSENSLVNDGQTRCLRTKFLGVVRNQHKSGLYLSKNNITDKLTSIDIFPNSL